MPMGHYTLRLSIPKAPIVVHDTDQSWGFDWIRFESGHALNL